MIDVVPGPDPADAEGDLLAVPVFADRVWGPGADWVAGRLGDWLDDYLDGQDFTGERGQTAAMPGADRLPYGQVLLLGLGDEVDAERLRRSAGILGRKASRYRTVVTTLGAIDIEGAAEATALGFILGQYTFEKYRSEPKLTQTERLVLAGADESSEEEIERGLVLADAVSLARDLVNEPAGAKPPEELARRAAEALTGLDVEVTIYDEHDIAERGFGGLAGVAAGAARPPRMVVMRYQPDGAAATIALAGKGIVFDSGGLSLKSPKGMETMTTDMAGAAAVIAATRAIARLQLPVAVLAITPLTENMPSGTAQHPGDVLVTYNGKTIEVTNTDSEGRLVLADALALAAETEPELIVDIATLTGAMQIALGDKIAGFFANDDDAAERMAAAAGRAGESVWRMPLEAEYRSNVDSPLADMKNQGGRPGSAILAALILSEFVGDVPWVHLDIAGPARSESDEHYVTQGGTGFGVRTLVAVAEDLAG